MKIYEKIKKLIEKPIMEWSDADRDFIGKLAEQNGIELNRACNDCWMDAAGKLYGMLKPQGEGKDACGYVLREGLDVVLHARNGNEYHICEATLTKENARKWLAAGAPVTIFAKLPDGGKE